nr:RHS repeat-associated core domain-containing protein [Luteibacter yeojuensis]
MKDDGQSKFEWNARQQLSAMTLSNGDRVEYKYDALGRRTERRGESTTTYLYDGGNAVMETRDGAATFFLNGEGLDQRFSELSSSGEKDFLTDELNTVLAITDESQSLVERYSYDAFGLPSGMESQNWYRFTGREWEGDGIYFYRARYYSAAMGRFISEDPMRFEGDGPNFYSYVGNVPTMLSDPTGLCPGGGDWWPFAKKREPTGEINPQPPKCPLPMPNEPLKPKGKGAPGCHAAMLEKIVKCSKKCPGIVDRASCIEEWRFREPDCAFMHAEE